MSWLISIGITSSALSVVKDNVESVDRTADMEKEDPEQDVDEKVGAAAAFDGHGNGREDDRDDHEEYIGA